MKPQLHAWITALFCCLLAKSVASADSRYEACEPRNCGTGPNISYPFYLEGVGADYCGFQSFRISSEQNRPTFRTSRGPYVVSDIDYQNNSIRLVDSDIINATCLAPKHYFAFDWENSDKFNFSPNHANLQYFYGCNESLALGLESSSLLCASNSTHHSFVALVRQNTDLRTVEYCERQVAVPIDLEYNPKANQTINTVNSTRLLTEGFTLLWHGSDASYCDRCRRSGGRCGRQNQATVCFCADGPKPTACGNVTVTGNNGKGGT
ncbi:hypothetical protein TIFTF001_007846 [Ficus carica]|uniref:non-specific serine/threonine protein kinase n=1 Tax=Ficus carica TaxID=3494 RepID=A0AA88A3P7_FICCA|nr:hypothetical protein TIFTF001_007846 [Ficus carica]